MQNKSQLEEAKPENRGRKKINPEEKREVLGIYINRSERESLQAAAGPNKQLSAWARTALLQAAFAEASK